MQLFSFWVYEVLDIGVRLGITDKPMSDLVCGFMERKQAEDWIKYQATISNKKYKVVDKSL